MAKGGIEADTAHRTSRSVTDAEIHSPPGSFREASLSGALRAVAPFTAAYRMALGLVFPSQALSKGTFRNRCDQRFSHDTCVQAARIVHDLTPSFGCRSPQAQR